MSGFWQKTKAAIMLFRRGSAMLLGNSYWHLPQGLGKRFVPGELAGYFNDLTGKAEWKGPVDGQGLPLNELGDKRIYFATTLFQKALGHWDLWLITNDETHLSEFLKLAQWALETRMSMGVGLCGLCLGCAIVLLTQP